MTESAPHSGGLLDLQRLQQLTPAQGSLSTVARSLRRLGLGRLRKLEFKFPAQRTSERLGELIDIDSKSLGCSEAGVLLHRRPAVAAPQLRLRLRQGAFRRRPRHTHGVTRSAADEQNHRCLCFFTLPGSTTWQLIVGL